MKVSIPSVLASERGTPPRASTLGATTTVRAQVSGGFVDGAVGRAYTFERASEKAVTLEIH